MSTARGDQIIDWIECLKTPEGRFVGEPLRLSPHQKDFIHAVYDQRRPDGTRIIREAVQSIPRKNGKTTFIAALVLVHLCGPEAARNAQLYSTGQDIDQAALTFTLASRMARMQERIAGRIKVLETRREIKDLKNGSVFKALSADAKTKLGFSTSFCIFDELAQAKQDRRLYNALRTSSGAQANPLFITISTQAETDLDLLSELIDYGLEGSDPTFYLQLFEAPKDADIFDPAVWYACNPALGVYRSYDELAEMAERARKLPSAEASFRNYYLNQRISGEAAFITPHLWRANGATADFDPDLRWHGGLDLATKLDLVSLVLVSRNEDRTINVVAWHWTPKDTIDEREIRDRAPYKLWVQRGYLFAIPGTSIGYDWVAEEMASISETFTIEEILFDRYRIDDLKRELDEIGVELPLAECGQGYVDFNACVEMLEEAVVAHQLRHGMNPVLTHAIANTVVDKDPAGNRKFTKKRSRGRIDGAVALAMALRSLGRDDTSVMESDDYEILVLG